MTEPGTCDLLTTGEDRPDHEYEIRDETTRDGWILRHVVETFSWRQFVTTFVIHPHLGVMSQFRWEA